MKLFAVYVGGLIDGCHVEQHDIRFVVADAIEDGFDALRAQWWGRPESLHLDAWGPLDWADGHDVAVVDGPDANENDDAARLFFLNMGGYRENAFTELHHNVFKVAPDWRAAKRKALNEISDWASPHKDAALAVETIVDVASAAGPAYSLRLTPNPEPRPFRFEARYVPIGRA